MKKIILFSIVLLYNCGTNEVSSPQATKLPNDIRWVTESPEYSILCEQTYKNAWDNLSSTLLSADSKSAIVMDLDETVLDNSKYQVDLSYKNETYNPESWSQWVNLEEAKLVPGAKNFIDKVRETKVKIIFLSNRMHKNLKPTISNMNELGVVNKNDIFLLRLDKEDKKHVRRNEITSGVGRFKEIGPLKVLGYFGDAKHDFPEGDQYFQFGKNMFMFPNPMYGKW